MIPPIYVLLTLSAIAIGFIVFDRLARWMERRGWIRWRKHKAGSGGGGGGGATAGLLTGFQQIIEPRVEHRIQVMEERNESIGQRLGRGDDLDGKPRHEAATAAGPGVANDQRAPTK